MKNFKEVAAIGEKQKLVQGICASSSSTLWYMRSSSGKKTDKGELIQLDCRSSPPQVKSTIEISKYKKTSIDIFMCFLNNGDKALIVVTQGFGGLTAYNTDTGQTEWTLTGKFNNGKFCDVSNSPDIGGIDICFTGVATDGRGHVFAGDLYNGCIHVLAADGKYLRTFSGGHSRHLNFIKAVRWCEKTSSLIVSHRDKSGAITHVNVK